MRLTMTVALHPMFWDVAKRFHKRYDGNYIAPWKYVKLLVILSWPKPWGILCVWRFGDD